MYGRYFVLFAILFTGWVLRKINFIDDRMNHSMNKLIVYFAYPCMIVHNIGSIDMDAGTMMDFLVAFIMSLVLFYLYGLISFVYAKARKYPGEISNVAELSMAMPNNGFMGFPVTLIFFGETGLLFMLAHNAAMNLFTFTYGMKVIRRNVEDKRRYTPMNVIKTVLKVLVNPNIIALVIGFIIGMMGGSIPEPVDEYLLYLGSISTPMAMIFIGSTLSECKVRDIVRDLRSIEISAVKLILLPLFTAGFVYFLPISGLMKAIIVLGISFPSAAIVSMLSEQEGQNVEVSSKALFLSTVVSIVTIPLTIKVLQIIFMQ